jgi:hypothetical protein
MGKRTKIGYKNVVLISEKSEDFPHVPYELSFHGDKTYEKIYLGIDSVRPTIPLYDKAVVISVK